MTPLGLPEGWDPFRPIDMLTSLWSSASTLPPVSSAAEVGYRTLFMTLRRLIVGRKLSVQIEDGEITLTVTEFDSSLDMLGLSVGQLGDVRIVATDLCWDRIEFDRAIATLHNVHLRPGTPPVLVAAPVELSLELPASILQELFHWVMPRFVGEVGDDGVARLHWARRPALGSLEVDAHLDGSWLWLKPRGLAVLRRRWPLPARAPAYPVRLPNLPHGLRLTGLSPVNEKSISASLANLGGIGDLASLAGITIPSARGNAPLAVLKSKSFVRQFIEDQRLMPVLFANKWDAKAGDWKIKGPDQPDIRDGVKYFDEKVRIVTEDKKASTIKLTIQWKDPLEASRWANLLVKRLNERMRTEAIRESETSIGYLQKEILSTNVVSLQNSIGRVLESDMQKMALARANEEFAFKVVDEAFPPKKRYFPQRTLIAITSALLGGFLGVIYVALAQLWRREK